MKLFFALAILISFISVDRDFRYKCDYAANHDTLVVMLETAFPGKEKADVYWRLSRASLMLGEQQQTKEAKREHFNRGIEWAEKGMKEYSTSKECYMWHCANVGRKCQTYSIIDQAAAVPVMTKDLETILDKFGHTDYSEAWQALSELYYHHPFKSKESAINFARKAATSIPAGELRLSTYTYLAEILYDRGWNARKRVAAAAGNSMEFNKEYDSNIEKYSYFDGALTYMPWSVKPFAQMSDKEEAAAILSYAIGLYNSCKDLTPVDRKDYKTLVELSEKMKK